MAVHNEISTQQSTDYLDSREIKSNPNGIKVRLFGDQFMGYSYYQKYVKDDGSDGVRVVRSKDFPVMKDETEGFKGSVQTPAKNLYSVAYDYDQEKAVLLTLDKVAIITEFMDVEKSEDLKSMIDYDFRITYDANKAPAQKYKVQRLDSKDISAAMKKTLEEFESNTNIQGYSEGGDAFEKTEE